MQKPVVVLLVSSIIFVIRVESLICQTSGYHADSHLPCLEVWSNVSKSDRIKVFTVNELVLMMA